MSAPDSVYQLVEKFNRNINEYKNPKYNETLIRVEFINPFWEALGWDVNNRAGYALSYRDVIHEDDIKVGASTKAPDYSFRVGGRRVFFLEAKKPAVDLKHNPEPAFQLRRYAWSAKLGVSMLTDFEELSLYDTRLKPAITDKAHVGRLHYYTFEEYIDKWDELVSTLSKEAVMRGDFDRFVEDKQGKRPGAELDRDFLNSLDEWRMMLARNLALRNPQLSERELNFAVQMTLDRLIFLRMAEDRGIENYGTLQALQNGENSYQRLVEVYHRADERYNSGLFHFSSKDGDHPDAITPTMVLDDKVLKEIIKNLYYPCPYEFSEFPVEVLGNAYEQFLGKRITLTDGHRARIEEKPEVRKAGGVYYTPQYIVDYIVEHTVGELLKDKTPKQVSDIRIVDPACGSGSFLLGAFQYLMDWHLKHYQNEHESSGHLPTSPPPTGQKPRKSDPQAIFQGKEGEWYLTTAEKKRILLNNIYGVDIDANAVEVTKLSLLLKVLEHEDSETLHRQMGLWHERALPNLGGNIKCGNSLIGPDYYDNQQGALFDETELLRVNAFDWQHEFSDVFTQGGFDAVIGNPPWGASFEKDEKEYLKAKFIDGHVRTPESFNYFIIQNCKIIAPKGKIGVIIPSSFLTQFEFWKTRKSLTKSLNVEIIYNLGDGIFNKVCAPSCIIIIKDKTSDHQPNYIDIRNSERSKVKEAFVEHQYDEKRFQVDNMDGYFLFAPTSSLIQKFSIFPKLKEVAEDVATGISSGLDKAYVFTDDEVRRLGFEGNVIRKLVIGREIKRYSLEPNSGKKILYLTPDVNIDNLPNIKSHLINFKDKLIKRREAANGKIPWFSLNWPRRLKLFEKSKILIRQTADRIMAVYDENGWFALKSAIIVQLSETDDHQYFYLLGLLNSKLMHHIYSEIVGEQSRTFPEVKPVKLFQLPIKVIDVNNSNQKAQHDRLVELVQNMLELHRRLAETREPLTQQQLERQITSTDTAIDKLVYQLYGLTDDEIKIVEESV